MSLNVRLLEQVSGSSSLARYLHQMAAMILHILMMDVPPFPRCGYTALDHVSNDAGIANELALPRPSI